MERRSDNLVGKMLDALLGAATLWRRREALDEELLASIHGRLLLERHREHVKRIPVIRTLAEEQCLEGPAEAHDLIRGMTLSTDVFKSYEPQWLEDADFAAMSAWLSDITTCRPREPAQPPRDLADWRAGLARQGIHVSASSGTSGRPSLVARDGPTWAALCGNGRFYADDAPGAGDYDLLALMPRGDALGLQGAASGLARQAGSSHFLGPLTEATLGAAVEFLEDRARRGRPLLVFGTPPLAAALCEAALADGPTTALPPGSRLLTGGGWKGGRELTAQELDELARRALGLDGDAIVDAYSATELNVVLSRCPAGRYHVPPLVQPLLFDDAMNWIEEAEATGLLGFFDPFAGSYPGLLVTGDQGHLSSERCSCRLAGWAVRGPIVRAAGHEPRGCAGALAERA
jgi:hypothetical protein